MEQTILPYAELMLCIEKQIQIEASMEIVFESLIDEMGPGMEAPAGVSMKLKLEAWPGGRWYRDMGKNTGHLWGHVQVIKPPTLLEISGPLMMSYPAVNHVQYRLTPQGQGTILKLTHRGFGDILPDHRSGMNKGWESILEGVKKRAQK